ncbi:MAG: DUF2961 domain-containing protein [Bacteroidales bacterium]|nr:DUF2961 domain-containing protein [Bacteroidales bacterium]
MFVKLLRVLVLLNIFGLIVCSCTSEEVTLTSLLEEMTGRENLTYFPARLYTHNQFSSYNRASVSPDKEGWFANYDMSHFLRVEENEGRREFVMFDAAGPGAVVRWWMTFYKAQNGTLRVYIDNESIPVLAGKPVDLLRGHTIANPPLAVAVQEGAPLGDEGRDYDHNFYVPLPFSKRCKITYECDSLVMLYENEGIPVPQGYWWPDVFYNIGYRKYSEDIKVESVSKQSLENARQLLDDAGEFLSDNIPVSSEEKIFEKIVLPGDSLVIKFEDGENAINRLIVELDAVNKPQALRSTVIAASFDGNRSVWVPVGEFFGAGYSQNTHRTWMNRVDDKGKMESFWVMPFRESCQLAFINYGKESVSLRGSAGLTTYRWKDGSMYFGASWHEYYHINSRDDKGSPFDLNFIDIHGKGLYAGDQVTLFNNTYQWWGEGDEKIFVDGESFPSSFGTGSEDYYGYSFGRQEPFSHPFISQPVGTGNMSWGPVVNMRLRSLDAIPFNKRIVSDIELWHWASVRLNYALTTFYYVMPPFRVNINPDAESVKHPVVLSKIDFTLGEKLPTTQP